MTGFKREFWFSGNFFPATTTLLVILLISCSEGFRIGDNPYHRAAFLDNRERFYLEWLVNHNTGTITFNVTVQTNGWIQFGFANNGAETTGRDLVIGGVDRDGQAYFSDRHTGRFNEKVEVDLIQDYTLHSSWEADMYTFLSFSRDLDTCDHQDYPITENKITLIWAYGDQDNENGDSGGHSSRDSGSYDVYLTDPEYSPKLIRANLYNQIPRVTGRETTTTQVWSITRRTRIPQNHTAYLCSIHKAPKLQRKHHVIGFDFTFADEQSQNYVHHVLVHRCREPPGTSGSSLFESYVQTGNQESCFSVGHGTGREGGMPTEYCQQVYMMWALGGRKFFLPDHVGFPFGVDSEEYYLVQVHYDNPNMRSDVTVTLNVDFFYTRRLRPNDGGIMIVGHEVPGLPMSTLIPPRAKRSRWFGHCSGECTERMLPKEGITVVAGFLHSHNSGRQVRLHHFRRNQELPWILYDDNYSNIFQQARALPRGEVQILPGDQLTMDCTFDSTWTNGTILGGFQTRQEMCLGFIFYYTLITDYHYCRSEIYSPAYRQQFLGVRNVTWNEFQLDWGVVSPSPRHLVGRTVTDISDSFVEWNRKRRQDLQQFKEQHVQVGKCNRDLHARDPMNVQRYVEMSQSRRTFQGLVLSGDIPTNLNTNDDYSGPVSYPIEAIPYTVPKDACLHKGIFVKPRN